MRRLRILVGVAPPPLSRVVDHLLGGRPEFRVVARAGERRELAQRAARWAPDLVVTNRTFLGNQSGGVIAAVKRFSPRAKVLLVGTFDRSERRRLGADSCLSEHALVRRLAPTLLRMKEPARAEC